MILGVHAIFLLLCVRNTVPNVLEVLESNNCLSSVFAPQTLNDLTAQCQSHSLFPFSVS